MSQLCNTIVDSILNNKLHRQWHFQREISKGSLYGIIAQSTHGGLIAVIVNKKCNQKYFYFISWTLFHTNSINVRSVQDHVLCVYMHRLPKTLYIAAIRHVDNIPTMQFFTGISKKYSVKIIYAIIDWVCLGILKK